MNSLEPGKSMELTDEEYVQRSRNGSPEDFRLLVERYQRPLFAYLSGRVSDASEAEEAAQESFVRAFLSLKKLRKPESFYSWLLGIAGRVLKEEWRASACRQQDRTIAESVPVEEPGGTPEYPLEEAIAALPETYRRVIVLRYYEDLSCQEVGQRLGMPLGTVTKNLSRAYGLLRQELQAREEAEQPLTKTQTNELR
jgi:RNA polymerase sigma-70 factor (ECF subfamily)